MSGDIKTKDQTQNVHFKIYLMSAQTPFIILLLTNHGNLTEYK